MKNLVIGFLVFGSVAAQAQVYLSDFFPPQASIITPIKIKYAYVSKNKKNIVIEGSSYIYTYVRELVIKNHSCKGNSLELSVEAYSKVPVRSDSGQIVWEYESHTDFKEKINKEKLLLKTNCASATTLNINGTTINL
jgi:hypothetical protein